MSIGVIGRNCRLARCSASQRQIDSCTVFVLTRAISSAAGTIWLTLLTPRRRARFPSRPSAWQNLGLQRIESLKRSVSSIARPPHRLVVEACRNEHCFASMRLDLRLLEGLTEGFQWDRPSLPA